MPEILPPVYLTDSDLREAEQAKQRVQDLLTCIQAHEYGLATNWARLGSVLYQVRDRKFWKAWGFVSFGTYVMHLGETVQKGRSQLYHIIGVAEALLPEMTEQQLICIGISKAGQLKRFKSQTGLRIPKNLFELASDSQVTEAELRAEVYREMRQEEEPKGRWREIGCYMLDDEWQEMKDAFEIASRVDPVIAHDIAEHAQRKEQLLRLAREFIGTYADLVARGAA